MKNNNLCIALTFSFLAMIFASCQDWLEEDELATTEASDYFTSGEACIYATNASYVPFMWEYNDTYYSPWSIGDIMSDDALKGGQNIGDMSNWYDMENWKTTTDNASVLDFFRAQYQGIARCNFALEEIPNVAIDSAMTTSVKYRLMGELKFLRAMYYFRLVRAFGGVPLVDWVVYSSDEWEQARNTADEVYDFILSDLEDASSWLWLKSEYDDEDLGRATKGAAQAMLLKVNLYLGNYEDAVLWGDSIINSGEYSLVSDYSDNFTLAGENGPESVFEIQYSEEGTSDYGNSNGEGGNGYTRGTFTTILTRSRSSQLGGGWGFNKPTQDLYDEFEDGDPRREATILTPAADKIENESEESYLGSLYLNRKYGYYNEAGDAAIDLDHASRSPLNYRVIRYADVLLMYAEACCENGDLASAKNALEMVRDRAREGDSSILPEFPDYNDYEETQDDLRKAIRHERRVELAMEGHRWYDLVRWGIAKETMDAYAANETQEAQDEMGVFIEGKHELLPIPSKEIELNPLLEQNPGY